MVLHKGKTQLVRLGNYFADFNFCGSQGFAGRTYHIVGNPMPRLTYISGSVFMLFYKKVSNNGFCTIKLNFICALFCLWDKYNFLWTSAFKS